MKSYGLNELREMYLSFFEGKQHLRMKSFPVVPQNDKSLLLINAGMAPLKPYFTGQEVPPSKRITTCQKCIRTGDIENVGKTARHLTCFEMLGNFSFGDYFKEEAISWAWEFVTEVIGIPVERLFVSVYEEDEQTAQIWKNKMGLPKEKIFYMGKEDNFWEVGVTGPCGPCSEIYFDRGPAYGCDSPNCTVGCECDRYIEFWNLVFTQFNREEDGSYTPLPNPNIDTGMGLERLAVMLQDVPTVFDVDTIKAIRDHVCDLAGIRYLEDAKKDVSVRVITDHIRSVTFMASDGVLPSNEGRGYVMRRLLRRAVRHGKLLGIKGLFLKEIVKTVVEHSKHEYTELEDKFDYIVKLLTVEEENFNKTIEQGLMMLNHHIEELQVANQHVLSGEVCFKLYDTYGFPIDLTQEILEEKNLKIDEVGFKEEMDKQRSRAREARSETNYMGSEETVFHRLDPRLNTTFVGYETLTCESEVVALTTSTEVVDEVSKGEEVYIVVKETPFYAESGGQVGDQGTMTTKTGRVSISQTSKVVGGKWVHQGQVVEGTIKCGQKITCTVDDKVRQDASRNHSATHLLQKALREVVGGHIEQAGSNVNQDRLRFDYTHFEPLSEAQIREVEDLVNEKILQGLPITMAEKSMEEARSMGAVALFGEKYGDLVRVVDMGGYSIELCGGTHLVNTAQIGTFKIVSETGVASGVRRIEAVTGRGTIAYYQALENTLNQVTQLVKAKKDNLITKVEGMIAEQKNLQKENQKLQSQMAKAEAEQVMNQVEQLNELSVLVTQLNGLDMNSLRQMGDTLKDQLGEGVVVLASCLEDKVSLVAMATQGAVAAGIHCGNIIAQVSKVVGGGGGGRPNMAQAGGKDATQVEAALQLAKETIKEQYKK